MRQLLSGTKCNKYREWYKEDTKVNVFTNNIYTSELINVPFRYVASIDDV